MWLILPATYQILCMMQIDLQWSSFLYPTLRMEMALTQSASQFQHFLGPYKIPWNFGRRTKLECLRRISRISLVYNKWQKHFQYSKWGVIWGLTVLHKNSWDSWALPSGPPGGLPRDMMHARLLSFCSPRFQEHWSKWNPNKNFWLRACIAHVIVQSLSLPMPPPPFFFSQSIQSLFARFFSLLILTCLNLI